MNTKEFSTEFDLLYNNIASEVAPGITEYEKSTFLTQAQEALVLDLYNGKYNGEAFDSTEEINSYIFSLMRTTFFQVADSKREPELEKEYCIGTPSRVEAHTFTLPEDILVITDEVALGSIKEKILPLMIIPVSRDNMFRETRNPFTEPNTRRALRITNYNTSISRTSTILVKSNNLLQYRVSYMKKPNPIILEDLEHFTINSISKQTECELPSSIHRTILNKAVQLAKAIWSAPTGSQSQ